MTLDRDDELLTALSHGVRADPDDTLAELLADWHRDLGADLPPAPAVRRRRWFLRPLAVGLAAGILAPGKRAAMASTAQPGSPLWPITQRVYPAKAQSRTAEQAGRHCSTRPRRRYSNAGSPTRSPRSTTRPARSPSSRTSPPATGSFSGGGPTRALLALQSTGTPSVAPPAVNVRGRRQTRPRGRCRAESGATVPPAACCRCPCRVCPYPAVVAASAASHCRRSCLRCHRCCLRREGPQTRMRLTAVRSLPCVAPPDDGFVMVERRCDTA